MHKDYSHKTTAEKLGIHKVSKVAVIDSPEDYIQTLRQSQSNIINTSLSKNLEFIQYFATDRKQLTDIFEKLKEHLIPTGMLWISWPKKSSKIASDLNENIIREIGLKNGLVDVKVISINENWSGLKFIYRIKDRHYNANFSK